MSSNVNFKYQLYDKNGVLCSQGFHVAKTPSQAVEEIVKVTYGSNQFTVKTGFIARKLGNALYFVRIKPQDINSTERLFTVSAKK
jgi:hypothetical protein